MSDSRPLEDRVIEALVEGNICREALALCAKTTERQQDTIEELKRKVALLESFVIYADRFRAEADGWQLPESSSYRETRAAIDWIRR